MKKDANSDKVGLGKLAKNANRETLEGHIPANKFLPTEELAELHAIIQAIEYERNSK